LGSHCDWQQQTRFDINSNNKDLNAKGLVQYKNLSTNLKINNKFYHYSSNKVLKYFITIALS